MDRVSWPPAADGVGVGPGQNFDDVIQTEPEPAFLHGAVDAGEKFERGLGAVERGARPQAIVAPAAVVPRKNLAEVAQQFRAAAAGRIGVMDDLLQLLAGDALFRRRFFLDEPLLLDGVARAEEQQALGREAVPSGAPGFLVIALDVFGQIVMDDEADVGLVDAHAEGDGGADHPHFVAQEKFLVLRPLAGGQPGVIRAGGNVVFD